MNNSLVYAQLDDGWRVQWHTQDNILSDPNPQFAFTDIPYDDNTGFIIETNTTNGTSRVLFYDLRPSPIVQTVVQDADGNIVYSNLMEFIPYPESQADSPKFQLALALARESYPFLNEKWMQCIAQPEPTYVVMTQADWLMTNVRMQSWQLAQQQAAYATYVAQQTAFFAKQRADFELALRLERERQIADLQEALERVTLTSPSSQIYAGTIASATDEESIGTPDLIESASTGTVPPSPLQFSKSLTSTSVKAPIAKKAAPPKPKIRELDADDQQAFLELLAGFPGSIERIYKFIKFNLKPIKTSQLEAFFKDTPIPFVICEYLVKRKQVPNNVKKVLLKQISLFPDDVYDEKVVNAISILNTANQLDKGGPLHHAIEIQYKNYLRRLETKPKVESDTVAEAAVKSAATPVQKAEPPKAETKATQKPKPVKPNPVKMTKKELSLQLFALLESGKPIKDKDLNPFDEVMHMVNDKGQTPLMVAIERKLPNSLIKAILITSSDDILTKDNQNRSILHYVALHPLKEDVYTEIFSVYIAEFKKLKPAKVADIIADSKDKNGDTFVHLLFKNSHHKDSGKVLDLFCDLVTHCKLAFCLFARDKDNNNIMSLTDTNPELDEYKIWILQAITNLAINMGIEYKDEGKLPPDMVDFLNLKRSDSIIKTLIAENNFTRLKELVLMRMFVRHAAEVDNLPKVLPSFDNNDFTDIIYDLVKTNSTGNLGKAMQILHFARECETSFRRSKYFDMLHDPEIGPQPNILQVVMIDILQGKIDFTLGIQVANMIVKMNPAETANIINEETHDWISTIDYVCMIMDEYQDNPQASQALELLFLLRDNGLDIRKLNLFQQNILNRACESYDLSTIRLLVNNLISDPTTLTEMLKEKDDQDRTPIQLAKERALPELTEFLTEKAREAIRAKLRNT